MNIEKYPRDFGEKALGLMVHYDCAGTCDYCATPVKGLGKISDDDCPRVWHVSCANWLERDAYRDSQHKSGQMRRDEDRRTLELGL